MACVWCFAFGVAARIGPVCPIVVRWAESSSLPGYWAAGSACRAPVGFHAFIQRRKNGNGHRISDFWYSEKISSLRESVVVPIFEKGLYKVGTKPQSRSQRKWCRKLIDFYRKVYATANISTNFSLL